LKLIVDKESIATLVAVELFFIFFIDFSIKGLWVFDPQTLFLASLSPLPSLVVVYLVYCWGISKGWMHLLQDATTNGLCRRLSNCVIEGILNSFDILNSNH
jgi:hypothetical protein